MKVHQVLPALLTGIVLLALGLIPGLFQSFTDGIQNLLTSISSPYPMRPPLSRRDEWRRPILLAVAGAALILLSLAEYLRLLR